MIFNSWQYLVFLPLVAVLYFKLPFRVRWLWLWVASIYFYMAWKPYYIVLLWFSTSIDYWVAMRLEDSRQPAQRLGWLYVSLISNLGVLFLFKYFNFFSSQWLLFTETPLAQAPAWLKLDLILPVGISFYTFQSLSYTIDVYRRQQLAERHFGRFALYVSFFPQLVAGPIERSPHLLPQFREDHRFDPVLAQAGCRLILWGLFKKMVIADRLALTVDRIYSHPSQYSGPALALATLFFAFQIYCDFSGYSNIAIGSAQVMGYRLMENFRRPYLAQSFSEFWRRWHISLSNWFRDYVYIPLGGNRRSLGRTYLNLWTVFLLSGLWHGANWTFVAWGGLHGGYLVGEQIFKRIWAGAISLMWPRLSLKVAWALLFGLLALGPLLRLCRIGLVFMLVCLAWIFFRANHWAEAWLILERLPTGWEMLKTPARLNGLLEQMGLNPTSLAGSLGLIAGLWGLHELQERRWFMPFFQSLPVWARWLSYLVLALGILNFGATQSVPFIYFQF